MSGSLQPSAFLLKRLISKKTRQRFVSILVELRLESLVLIEKKAISSQDPLSQDLGPLVLIEISFCVGTGASIGRPPTSVRPSLKGKDL